MVFRKKPVAKRRRVPKRRPARKSTVMTASKVRSIALKAVEKTREIKKLWGAINTTESANILTVPTGSLVPSFVFSEGTDAYVTTCLNLTKQGLENENRIGNVLQPVRFTLKGYGVVTQNTSAQFETNISHVRVICGFRRQKSLLNTSLGNLMMQGGTEVPLQGNYEDIMNSLNWKEFRPFYDKVYKIGVPAYTTNNWQSAYPKNYFHYNIDHKFGPMEQLVSNEESDGTTANLYNNKNIYVLFLCRQMNNNNDTGTLNCKLFGTSLFQFHDA
jgi:hypothetical protein